MELADITKKIETLTKSFFQEEKQLSTTERVCISFREQELSILCINHHPDMNEIIFMDKLKFDDAKSLPLPLKGMIEKYNLSQIPLTWLLKPNEYQINLIESIPVPKDEFLTALSWRVRSLISYPLDEAVMEYFELPAKKNAPNSPLIAAVTAQRLTLRPAISLYKSIGLSLTRIDIPELAMLSLAALYENDEKSTAFLYFYEKFIILNISNRKVLYFTRRIDIPYSDVKTIDYEKLSLEILRFFDFYRSQWRQSAPARIFIACESGDPQIISKVLAERLLNPVTVYTLNHALLSDKFKTEISIKFLLEYGCLLRQDAKNAASGN